MVDSKKSSEILENSNVSFWRAFECSKKGMVVFQKGSECFLERHPFRNCCFQKGSAKGQGSFLVPDPFNTLFDFRPGGYRLFAKDSDGGFERLHRGTGSHQWGSGVARAPRLFYLIEPKLTKFDGNTSTATRYVLNRNPPDSSRKRVAKGVGTFIERVWACFRCLTLFDFAPYPFRNRPKLKGVGTFSVRVPRVRARIHLHLQSSDRRNERTRARDGPEIKSR